MTHYELEPRKVYLPFQNLNKCYVCGASSPRLCSACGEEVYCSRVCQKKDWKRHKAECGSTDRISLKSFYPFLACLAEVFRGCRYMPLHPALKHTIINTPIGPGTNPIVSLPSGSRAKVVMLGEPLARPRAECNEEWWPTAASPAVRAKLYRRIHGEGYALPFSLALCIALLAGMYTTTAVPPSQSPDGEVETRIRLRYGSSPISDFGVVKGATKVLDQDRLTYLDSDGAFNHGQDPNDHYWVYFTTVRGETAILDCAGAAFNVGSVVLGEPYMSELSPQLVHAPAFFPKQEVARYIYKETERFSILRNTALHRAVEHSWPPREFGANIISNFMEKIAGRACSTPEKDLVVECSRNGSVGIAIVLRDRAWASWPEKPVPACLEDPTCEGNTEGPNFDDEKAWKFITRRARKSRQGELTVEGLQEAVEAWKRKRKLAA